MSTPTIRPDAVDHYAALLADNTLPSEGLCLTAVRQVTVPQALVRFDGFSGSRRASVRAAGQVSVAAYPEPLPIVVADDLDGWTLLVEDNGFHGSRPEVLSALSRGSVAVSVYWNVNRVSRIGYADDGALLASFDFVLQEQPYGEDPDRIRPFLSGLTSADPYRNTAEALAFIEHVTGARITRRWLEQSHPASVVVASTAFEPSGMDSWLEHVAPAIAAAASGASRRALRAAAASVATGICDAVRVDDPRVLAALTADPDTMTSGERAGHRDHLLASAREAYRQALELCWDRCQAPAASTDPVSRLKAEHMRDRTPGSGERSNLARAHALGASFARLNDDPWESLTWVLVNAYRASPEQWPRLRDQATAALHAS